LSKIRQAFCKKRKQEQYSKEASGQIKQIVENMASILQKEEARTV
jgi:hypothetical protein